jgi:tetratricopeptide (TPR) repeat protein
LSADTCLRQIRLIGLDLWRADRRRFSINTAIDLTPELLRRHPRSARDWTILSDLLMSSGEWEEGLSAAQVGCAVDPSYGHSWSTLARCYLGLGRIREGEEAYQVAAQLVGPDYRPDSHLLLLGRYGDGWQAWAKSNGELMAGKRGACADHEATAARPPPLVG